MGLWTRRRRRTNFRLRFASGRFEWCGITKATTPRKAAIASIASKIGCTAESLRRWLRQAERDAGMRPGATTDERERIKALERENRELRQANEILRKASAYFAQAELDRRFKP